MKDKSASPGAPSRPSSIHFAMIESPVIRSQQLTLAEKVFYNALKSYFHTNSPYTCHPSLETLAKGCNLSKASIYRIKDSLKSKGLIKYEPGRGRRNTNSYQFPLVSGSDEEKKRLLAFLGLKEKVSPIRPFNENKAKIKGLTSKKKRSHPRDPNRTLIYKSRKEKKEKTHLQKDEQKRKKENFDLSQNSLTLKQQEKKELLLRQAEAITKQEEQDLPGQTKIFDNEILNKEGVVKTIIPRKKEPMINPQEMSVMGAIFRKKEKLKT